MNSCWVRALSLLGLGLGGEWAAGAVLLGESIRAEHRGKALGMMQAGWAVGWGVATILYAVSFTHLPQETAWRALFMVGILPALFVFFVRRYVEEPPIYLETRSKLEAVGVFAGIAYATMAIAAFLLPETKGKVLAAE